jgi:hypothetical protein
MRDEDKTDMTVSPWSWNQIRAGITQSQRSGCARGCWVWELAVILSPFPYFLSLFFISFTLTSFVISVCHCGMILRHIS